MWWRVSIRYHLLFPSLPSYCPLLPQWGLGTRLVTPGPFSDFLGGAWRQGYTSYNSLQQPVLFLSDLLPTPCLLQVLHCPRLMAVVFEEFLPLAWSEDQGWSPMGGRHNSLTFPPLLAYFFHLLSSLISLVSPPLSSSPLILFFPLLLLLPLPLLLSSSSPDSAQAHGRPHVAAMKLVQTICTAGRNLTAHLVHATMVYCGILWKTQWYTVGNLVVYCGIL